MTTDDDAREPPPIPYELRIGVTGHCSVPSASELEAAVRDFVRRNLLAPLQQVTRPSHAGMRATSVNTFYRMLTWVLSHLTAPLRLCGLRMRVVPHAPRRPPAARRTPVDLTVVTSLAPGSDQIVARAITECVERRAERNRVLEAILPMPADAYARLLAERGEAPDGFFHLLALDRGANDTNPEPAVVYPDFANRRDPDDPGQPLPPWKAYRDAGREVIESSEIVLAIWNPAHKHNPGGTEDVIDYALSRGRLVFWLNPADLPSGPRVLRRLVEGRTPAPDAPDGYQTEPSPTHAKALSRNYHRLAAYNRDPAWDSVAYRRLLEKERSHFREAAAGLPGTVAGTIERLLLPHFVRADQLALRYHALRNFVAKLLPGISALAITFIAFQIFFLPDLPELATIEILLILIGYLSYRLSVHEAWHDKWLNDRHLAERLRALVYAGLLPSGRTAGDDRNLLPFYRPTNEWFTSTLARFGGRLVRGLPPDFDPAAHVRAIAQLIGAGWITQQAGHHAEAHEREAIAIRFSKAVTACTLAGVLVVATLHALGVGHRAVHEGAGLFARVDLWIAFFTIAIPAWGGALQVVDSMHDHSRILETAGLMRPSLEGVGERLLDAGTLDDIDRCVSDARRIIELESEEHIASMRRHLPKPHV